MADEDIQEESNAPVAVIGRRGESPGQIRMRHQGFGDETTGYTAPVYGRHGGSSRGSPLLAAAQLAQRQEALANREEMQKDRETLDETKFQFEQERFDAQQSIHQQALTDTKNRHVSAAQLNKALAAIDYRDPNYHTAVNDAFTQFGDGADDPRVTSQFNRMQESRAGFESRGDEMQKRIQEAEEASGVPMQYFNHPDGSPDLMRPNFAAHGTAVIQAHHDAAKAAAGNLPVKSITETREGYNTEFADPLERKPLPDPREAELQKSYGLTKDSLLNPVFKEEGSMSTKSADGKQYDAPKFEGHDTGGSHVRLTVNGPKGTPMTVVLPKAEYDRQVERAKLPLVSHDDDFNSLKSGDEFIDPEGNRRKKP